MIHIIMPSKTVFFSVILVISLIHFYLMSNFHMKIEPSVNLLRGVRCNISSSTHAFSYSIINVIETTSVFHVYGAIIDRKFNENNLDVIAYFSTTRNTIALIRSMNATIKCSSSSTLGDIQSVGRLVDLKDIGQRQFILPVYILRCKLRGNFGGKLKSFQSSSNISINVLIEDRKLFNFYVPWKDRKSGFMLSLPYEASRFNAWAGVSVDNINNSSTGHSLNINNRYADDNLYICVSGVDLPPSKDMLPLYLEFVQHHLLLGAAHIFLGVRFDWDSSNMRRLLQVFSSYINEGTLTIASQTVTSSMIDGLLVDQSLFLRITKSLYINMCLYLSKGMADYIGVWDIDEFFMPKLPHNSIIDVIRSLEATSKSLSIIPTEVIDSNHIYMRSHSNCFIELSEVSVARSTWIHTIKWIGEKFTSTPLISTSTNRSSVGNKTRHPYLVGLSCCNLCTCNCKSTSLQENIMKYGNNNNNNNNNNKVNLEKSLLPLSSSLTLSSDQTIIGDMMIMYRFFVDGIISPISNYSNDYTLRFFPTVRIALQERGLAILITLPEKTSRQMPDIKKDWVRYETVYNDSHSINNYSHITTNYGIQHKGIPPIDQWTTLPSMAVDLSEVFLGALLERNFDSNQLHLTVFMLCHAMLDPKTPGLGAKMIRNNSAHVWIEAIRKFEETKYTLSGQRESSPRCLCRISNKAGDSQYIVEGTFMPNRLTLDAGANRRADILRCKMNGEYQYLAGSEENVQVEILRENEVLIKFIVPWRTRKTGYMLTVEGGDAASRFDPWKGYVSTTSSQLPLPHLSSSSSSSTLFGKLGSQEGDSIISNSHHQHHRLGNTTSQSDNIYMCVPGIETPPGRNILPLYLEFVQHHLLLGVDHMFLTASFPWGSPHMKRLLLIFASYIQEGSVSISSQAGDGIDYLNSFEGIYWNRNIPKVIFINMCLYLSKGMADYVGVWDIDEFFIPKLPHNSIIDVIRSLEAPVNGITIGSISNSSLEEIRVRWKGGRGLADGDGHPFCYLSLSSLVVLKASDTVDPEHPWLGERFSHGPEGRGTVITMKMGFKKTILPTRTVFQTGLHYAGACKLDGIWNGCGTENNEFCYLTSNIPRKKYTDPIKNSFHLDHRFDELVTESDYKRVDPNTDALIYHYYSAHRDHLSAENRPVSLQAKQSISEYSSRFFPNVMAQLEARNLARLVY